MGEKQGNLLNRRSGGRPLGVFNRFLAWLGYRFAQGHKIATSRLTYLVVGLGFLYLLFQLVLTAISSPGDYFEVEKIQVSNFSQGSAWSDVDVSYPRVIHRTVEGDWRVEMHPVKKRKILDDVACSGSGTHTYKIGSKLRESEISLEWYLGNQCIVPPGEYILLTRWDFRPNEITTKRVEQISNVFRVFPSKSK